MITERKEFDSKEVIMEEYEGSEPTEFKYSMTYKQLYEMLLCKDYGCSLVIILHFKGWAWCEFNFNNNRGVERIKDNLTFSMKGKEELYNFIVYFIELENVSISGDIYSSDTASKLMRALDIARYERKEGLNKKENTEGYEENKPPPF